MEWKPILKQIPPFQVRFCETKKKTRRKNRVLNEKICFSEST